MAYIVLKGKGFWKNRHHLTIRNVSTFNFFGFKRVIRSEKYIRKSRVIIIQGGFGSGKTRDINKLFVNSRDIWGLDGVYFACGEGLENWFRRAGLSNDDVKGLKQFEKVQKLIQVCNGKVVFLDDIDRLDNKVKLDAVKWLIRVSSVVVVSCKDVNKVNDGLEYELRKKLRLRPYQGLGDYVVDLGGSEVEVKDVGMVVAIVLIVFVAFAWGFTYGLLGALALRWLSSEGRRSLK